MKREDLKYVQSTEQTAVREVSSGSPESDQVSVAMSCEERIVVLAKSRIRLDQLVGRGSIRWRAQDLVRPRMVRRLEGRNFSLVRQTVRREDWLIIPFQVRVICYRWWQRPVGWLIIILIEWTLRRRGRFEIVIYVRKTTVNKEAIVDVEVGSVVIIVEIAMIEGHFHE